MLKNDLLLRYEHLFIIFAVENNKYLMSPRPKNIRKVNNMPSVAGFKPIASNSSRKDTIFLHFEEYEAIRLCDYEMKTQQEASVSMGVSVYATPPSIIITTPRTSAWAIFWRALVYIRLRVGRDTPIETDASCWVFIS